MSFNSRISGPVSMYYLKPNDSSLPLFLLFGDYHFSYDNMCSKCTCDNTKTCCHTVYDTNFLTKLEKLARPQTPVDFYVEYFDDNEGGSFNSPLDKFREPAFQTCYKRTLKKQGNCPAPSIRWHYSDIRLSNVKNNIEYIFDSIYVFTEFCNSLNKNKSYDGMPLDTWLEITDHVHNKGSRNKRLLEMYKKNSGIDIVKKQEIHEIIDLLSGFKNKPVDEIAQDIIEFIFSYDSASSSPSLIYKQFKKQVKTRTFADKQFIVNMMKESLVAKLVDYTGISDETLHKLSKFTISHNYKAVSNLLLHINSTFMDLYTVLRATKRIDDPPSLCITYFGNAHVLNIVNILMNSGYYRIKASVEENQENRCLPFAVFDDLQISLQSRLPRSHTRSKTRSLIRSKTIRSYK